ncbi:hypothetical protein HDF26_004873 [Pedobacter cryoconitis]|uniref:Uncharacterized protein n=1 Tax=Pedobacter cryoconitis TaxID=188932 RepID=A0A7W8ZRR7_9SPHI|nr:hypothetical protein [Pedobacter cryoconitis]MBB6274399.1 hypothetical protein [Pedobacter cryoconitis]
MVNWNKMLVFLANADLNRQKLNKLFSVVKSLFLEAKYNLLEKP